MQTIRPPLRVRIMGRHSGWTTLKNPSRLAPSTWSQSSPLEAGKALSRVMPALQTMP